MGGGYLSNLKITPKKSLIIGIALGILIGGVGVGAATYFSADQVSYTPSDTSWNVSSVKSATDSLYTDLKTGKKLIAAAITSKGVTTSTDDTFEAMASNISSIKSGTYGTWKIDVSGLENYDATNKKWYTVNAPAGMLWVKLVIKEDGSYSLRYPAGKASVTKE